jgi:hypothetical protein
MADFFELSSSNIDFGCIPLRNNNKKLPMEPVRQTLTLTNNTASPIRCEWQQKASQVFFVSPGAAEIASQQTTSFEVCFLPDALNRYFDAELECYVNFVDMFKEETVPDPFFCVPQCFTVAAAGNSFGSTPPAPPSAALASTQLSFPVAEVNIPVFEATKIINNGDTAVRFEFKIEETSPWTVLPRNGIVAPHSQETIVFEVTPSEPGPFSYLAQCVFNDSLELAQTASLSGCAERPSLKFDNDNTLYFPPTSVGLSNLAMYQVQNTSALHIAYEWKIPSEVASQLSINPTQGTLQPFEKLTFSCMFRPSKSIVYTSKISCSYSTVQRSQSIPHPLENLRASRASLSHRLSLTAPLAIPMTPTSREVKSAQMRQSVMVVGHALTGEIVASKAKLECGNIVLGSSFCGTFTISNPTLALVQYRLIADSPGISLERTEVCRIASSFAPLKPFRAFCRHSDMNRCKF